MLRTYVFVYASSETMDVEGFDTNSSFYIQACNIAEAVEKLTAYTHAEFGWSSNTDDVHDDIERGNIGVYVPTVIP